MAHVYTYVKSPPPWHVPVLARAQAWLIILRGHIKTKLQILNSSKQPTSFTAQPKLERGHPSMNSPADDEVCQETFTYESSSPN